MGKFYRGILGGFNGKIGTVVGGHWRGIDYMRALAVRSKTAASEAQLIQQARFKLAVKFIQPIQAGLKIGYQGFTRRKTPLNVALSEIISNAIVGDYPSLSISYGAVKTSKGTLLAPSGMTTSMNNKSLVVNWVNPTQFYDNNAKDNVVLIVVPEISRPVMSLLEVTRDKGSVTLAIPDGVADEAIHIYLSFASATTNEVSNSAYISTTLA